MDQEFFIAFYVSCFTLAAVIGKYNGNISLYLPMCTLRSGRLDSWQT
jgi:hypothetical protein